MLFLHVFLLYLIGDITTLLVQSMMGNIYTHIYIYTHMYILYSLEDNIYGLLLETIIIGETENGFKTSLFFKFA